MCQGGLFPSYRLKVTSKSEASLKSNGQGRSYLWTVWLIRDDPIGIHPAPSPSHHPATSLVSSIWAQAFLWQVTLAYMMRRACWFLIEISFKQKVASIPQPSLLLSRWRKVTLFTKHSRLEIFPKRLYAIVDTKIVRDKCTYFNIFNSSSLLAL